VASVVDRLLHLAAQLEQQPVVLVHGDLHLKNFFVDGNQIALIDLDDLRLGSPWQDIGSFMAALHYRGLLAGTSTTETERAAALVDGGGFRAVTRLQGSRLGVLDALLVRAGQIIAQRGYRP